MRKKNTFDGGFIKVFAPIRIVQIILGSCRVNVRDNVVTAPTVFQKFFTISVVIISTVVVRSLLLNYSEIYYTNTTMTYMYTIGLSSLHYTFCLSALHCRFINQGNVQLYEKMQNVDRIMNINWSDNGQLRINHYKLNRTVVLSLLAIFSTLIFITVYMTRGFIGVHEILGNNWGLCTFVLEMACCSSHLKFFIDRVNRVNSIIAHHLMTEKISGNTLHIICSMSTNLRKTRLEFESSETDIYLNEIFSAFTCFQNQYRFQVFIFCQLYIAFLVVSFQYITTALQNNVLLSHLTLDLVIIAIITLLNVCMLLLQSIRSEEFLRAVNKTKKLSNTVLSRYLEGTLRQKAKKMHNLIERNSPRFCVYGMWYVDARLLLNMFGIITNAFVIILQFALS